MYRYKVTADITYDEGALAGLLIENGYEVNMPDYKHALRVIRWIEKTMRANDFVRAVGTSQKYRFRSFPKAVRINA